MARVDLSIVLEIFACGNSSRANSYACFESQNCPPCIAGYIACSGDIVYVSKVLSQVINTIGLFYGWCTMAVQRVLGIDLGPNSIGWALIDDNPDSPSESRLVDLGVRVFPEGVDQFDTSKEASRSENRRIARGMRRQNSRRRRRRQYLRTALIEAGLWPANDPATEAVLYNLDPYLLRSRALQEKLSPHEIGRILLHLNQRRGFKSNRKQDRGDNEVKGMLAEINQNEEQRVAGGFETIGAWLADKCPKAGKQAKQYHANRQENDHGCAIATNRNRTSRASMPQRHAEKSAGKQKSPADRGLHDLRRTLSPWESGACEFLVLLRKGQAGIEYTFRIVL